VDTVAFLLNTQFYYFARDVGADLDLFFRIDLPAGGDDLGDTTMDNFLRRDADTGVPAEYTFEQDQGNDENDYAYDDIK
jgi:hypothetical protein